MSNAESRLKIGDSIYSVIYEVIDKGSGSPDDLMEARLSAEDLSMMIVDSVFSEIDAESGGEIIAVLNPNGPLDEDDN
jgi:hypothetical protein